MRKKLWFSIVVAVAFCFTSWAAPEGNVGQSNAGEHWVTTWATSQLLTPIVFRRPVRDRPSSAPASGRAESTPKTPPQNPPAPSGPPQVRSGPLAVNLPPKFENETVRMIGRASIGGRRVRIELSNMLNAQPLEVGAVHIAIHKGTGAIVEGTDRALTFGGSASFTIQPGVLVVSDPVELHLPPLGEFAVSLYLPHDTGVPTNHMLGLHTAYIGKGNLTASASMANASTMFSYVWLASVDVIAPAAGYTIVALGDSITDGFQTTRNTDRAWPALLAKRLNSNKANQEIAVANEGISGNQVLRDGAGMSALARLDRDVLSLPGVKWVILLEGINDINFRGRSDGPDALTSDELIWGYRQIIARCHQHNIKVIGATIMPEEGVPTASERGEKIRQEVNRWIREKDNFDAIVDFDAVVRDPQRSVRLKPEFDPGDHIHPNDAGNQAMADAFDLALFKM